MRLFFPPPSIKYGKMQEKKKKKEIGNQSLKETWYMSISIVTLECVLYVHVYTKIIFTVCRHGHISSNSLNTNIICIIVY